MIEPHGDAAGFQENGHALTDDHRSGMIDFESMASGDFYDERMKRRPAAQGGKKVVGMFSGHQGVLTEPRFMTNRKLGGWMVGPMRPMLPDGEVQVWQVAIDSASCRVEDLRGVLSAGEVARADRYRFEKDRQRSVVARGVLRNLLGRYLGLKPESVRFVTSAYGKPALDPSLGLHDVRFNVSHSGDQVLLGFAAGRDVGVDIERRRTVENADRVAEGVFSPQEFSVYRVLPAWQKEEAFFNCWTRKEAYIKARGKGLALALGSFDVSFVPGESARLLATRNDAGAADAWELRALDVGGGYAAAVAAQGRGWGLQCWALQSETL
ncbi:MAG: 4'-phosphopantetheinyl transferase superfamily protein [Planctomycetes bacterium]|nr:4'-phosphopantetheinyl transferase superfamily protein [Planctomycetota bacterium]